jgi:hypothetical protein
MQIFISESNINKEGGREYKGIERTIKIELFL